LSRSEQNSEHAFPLNRYLVITVVLFYVCRDFLLKCMFHIYVQIQSLSLVPWLHLFPYTKSMSC